MPKNLGPKLASGYSMNDGDWLTSSNSRYTLKLVAGELYIYQNGQQTAAYGYGPYFPGDTCTMTVGGNLVIGPMSGWQSGTSSPGAVLTMDDDGVARIRDVFGNPIQPLFVTQGSLLSWSAIGAGIVEAAKAFEVIGMGVLRIASQLKNRPAIFDTVAPSDITSVELKPIKPNGGGKAPERAAESAQP